ncbi:MAG: DUF5050 domain-containing protein [Candidatus Bipolaricaulota bacterium]
MNTRRLVLVCLVLLTLAYGLVSCDWLRPPEVPIPPTVGFAPLASAVHTLITIVGEGFGAPAVDVDVTFDGVEAAIETWTDTNLVVRVPVVATPTGRRAAVVEVRRGGVLLGSGTFTVLRGILFETDRDGDAEIYVMNPDGSQPTNLTNHDGLDSGPVWSPDGTKIAFETNRDGNWEIYTMNADGTEQTNRSEDAGYDGFARWSPDGAKIAFVTDRESTSPPLLSATPKLILPGYNLEIFVMRADGGGQTNLTQNPAWDTSPSWSPDGQRIVFETDRDTSGIVILASPPDLGREIYAMDADGDNVTRLSNSPEDDLYPMWSPVGSKIVFQSSRDGNPEIYVMNGDGSGQVRLTDHVAQDSMPCWSPDGNWITFQSGRDGNTEIYKVALTGTSTTRLTNSADEDWGPSWSPDGAQIVFATTRDGDVEIYRMNADGSAATRLTQNGAVDVNAFWDTPTWPVSP